MPAFGFAFGDFVAVVNLFYGIYQCVASTNQAKGELEALSKHFRRLCTSFQRILDVSQQDPDCLPPETQNGLQFHFEQCRKHLKKFAAAIQPLKDNRNGVAASESMKIVARRAAFATRRTSVIQRLLEAFGREQQAIQLYVDVIML